MRKPKTLEFWWDRLPHWEVEGGRYFITLHLAGAIPVAGQMRLREVAQELRQTADRQTPNWLRLQRAIFAEMERWLDQSEWNPLLQRPEIGELVCEAIEHRQQRGDWLVHEYVVMPTHLHICCEFSARHESGIGRFQALDRTSRVAILNKTTKAYERFWQREWFDHWSRSDEEDDRIIAYIRNNPVKANLATDYRQWPFGSWRSSGRSHLPDGT